MPSDTAAPKPLVIFGAGSLARLVRAYFVRDTEHEIAACTVNREYIDGARLDGLPSVPFEELERGYPPAECSLFVAVGYTDVNRRRAEIFEQAVSLGYHIPTLVSSRSHCWDDLRIGRNCIVFDGVVVEPNVQLGDDVIAWSGSQISHDSSIGNHCFLGPSAVVLGDVVVGDRSFVGANATIRNGVRVAEDSVVGAGTLVKRDTAPGEVYSAERTRAQTSRHAREGIQL
jgi:sugar O-acyltransferase (sialic acid O-acetyltransferase NeuD family)